MNPLTYISNITRNSKSNVEKINEEKSLCQSREIIAILVFIVIYIFIRLIEKYVIPIIPGFISKEISSLFRWGPILVPIVFGITYFSKNKVRSTSQITSDNTLKERMMAWTKK